MLYVLCIYIWILYVHFAYPYLTMVQCAQRPNKENSKSPASFIYTEFQLPPCVPSPYQSPPPFKWPIKSSDFDSFWLITVFSVGFKIEYIMLLHLQNKDLNLVNSLLFWLLAHLFDPCDQSLTMLQIRSGDPHTSKLHQSNGLAQPWFFGFYIVA